MNILIIPTWYSTKKNPVRGSFIREQAVALSKYGHNVSVVYVSLHPRKEFISRDHFKLKEFNDNNIKTYRFSIPSFGVERNKKVFFKVYYSQYRKIIRKLLDRGEKFDVIHAHSFYPAGYIATLLKREFNIPIVITEHLSAIPSGSLSNEKIEYLDKTIINSNKFITVSESLKRSINEITSSHYDIKVIPNVLSPNFYYEKTIQSTVQKKFKIISVGGLIDRKRHSLLIEVFSDVFKNNKNVELNIIGDGVERNNLQNLIEEKNISSQVKLLGILSREETAKKMRESDIFVLLSSFETFGVVYIEALASGLPVIATVNGGAEHIITKEDGILIDVDSKEQLSSALVYMYNNSNKYNRKEISDKCIKKFSENTIATMLTNEYIDTLKQYKKMEENLCKLK